MKQEYDELTIKLKNNESQIVIRECEFNELNNKFNNKMRRRTSVNGAGYCTKNELVMRPFLKARVDIRPFVICLAQGVKEVIHRQSNKSQMVGYRPEL
jgi:hypothetical protein